jgi:hypothetical protein
MFTIGKSQRNPITPDANATSDTKAASKLANGKHNKFILLTIEATLNVTTILTGIKNRGSVLALFPLLGVDEDDSNVIAADGRLMGVVSDSMRTTPGSAVRLTSLAVGTYKLREQIKISFENPFGARSRETQFLEHELTSNLRAFMQSTLDVTKICTGGAANLTGVTARVLQVYDNEEKALPVFRTKFEQLVLPVASALDGFDMPLQKADYLRAITIQQDTTGAGEVNDIIQKISLTGDNREYIGGKSGPVSFADLAQSLEFEAGGSIYASSGCRRSTARSRTPTWRSSCGPRRPRPSAPARATSASWWSRWCVTARSARAAAAS